MADSQYALTDGTENTSWLRYLPGIYAEDPFLAGFLRIFEDVWSPLDRQLGQIHCYIDPALTPAEFLPWLGSWVDLALDENWPEARRRDLIGRAADLFRRRGTPDGLRDYLETYLGVRPIIREFEDPARPYHFSVVLPHAVGADLDLDRVRRIITEEKPAHTTFSLTVESA
jgi:phage tail-like protein